jgi:hypothetical protein
LGKKSLIPHLEKNRELSVNSAVLTTTGGAQELKCVLSLHPDQRRSWSTAERTLQPPLGIGRRTYEYWFLRKIFKYLESVFAINK